MTRYTVNSCDRCGRITPSSNAQEYKKLSIQGKEDGVMKKWDLCGECYEAFWGYFDTGKAIGGEDLIEKDIVPGMEARES